MTDSERVGEIARKHALLASSVEEIAWLIGRARNLEAALRKIQYIAGDSTGCSRCIRIHEVAYRAERGKDWEVIDG